VNDALPAGGIATSSAALRAGYQRHLTLDPVVDPTFATDHQRFAALARAIRDLLADRWLGTIRRQELANPKRVYPGNSEHAV
jgi:hypothetical protein